MWEVWYENNLKNEFGTEEEATKYAYSGERYWDIDEVDIVFDESEIFDK